jgi:16S rRNA (adenine1518-N6/adenine1519-N6)-dimethyltransferase
MLVRPKKSLGQHFLKDQNIARKIVGSIEGAPNLVLEIGPGMGVLTRWVIDKNYNYLLIEIDNESVEFLRANLNIPEDKIIANDFLKLNLSEILKDETTVIGNLPYNISSQIFFKIINNRDRINQAIFMVQKEVAERIVSKAGNKSYGILSVFLQTFYNISYLFTVNENVFHPPPKVKSSVIRLIRNNRRELECDEVLFFKVVKTAFNQRRKTLRNSLRSLYPKEYQTPDIFSKRPEQLNTDDFIFLTNLLDQKYNP